MKLHSLLSDVQEKQYSKSVSARKAKVNLGLTRSEILEETRSDKRNNFLINFILTLFVIIIISMFIVGPTWSEKTKATPHSEPPAGIIIE